MKKRNYIVNLLFAAAVLLTGCSESLEETYSDYAGDGRIRYVAKCTSVYTTPGWERLLVTWVNGTDATTDQIKVVWSCEDQQDSVLLPKISTSYELKSKIDGTYRFDVCSIDKYGNESLRETTYGRPYTRDHEVMRAFTRGVVKSYFLKNKMIFFSDQWNENIVEMKLQYKNTTGETKYYEFKKASSYNTLVTIDDVSMAEKDTVYVLRKGMLEGSLDVIPFDPYVISRKKNFSAGFVQAIESRYGYSTETKEQEDEFISFIETTPELELDYDLETLDDILYCSNLEKLVVGKNRYLHALSDDGKVWQTEYDNSKILKDPAKSYQVIQKASEVLGLKVHYYGNEKTNIHYFDKVYRYMVYEGFPELPDLKFIKADELKTRENGHKIHCTPEDPYAKLDNLLDDNANTRWSTISIQSMRTHEMHMELLESTDIRGIKVAQIEYAKTESEAPYFMPTLISIETSTDGAIWKKLTRLESNQLGRGVGEVTLLLVAEGSRQVRYVRITVRDGVDKVNNWMCKLGDIMLYK